MNLAANPPANLPPSRWRRIAGVGVRSLLAVVLFGLGVWSTLAVYYSNLPGAWLRTTGSIVYAVALVMVLLRVRPFWRARLVFFGAFGLVVIWFFLIPPSNDRDWQPDVAVLPYADIEGNKVTLHHIRNCDYRTETDFNVRHYDRTVDLAQLRTVDLFMVYWGSPHMAHTMVSFRFGNDEYVCFSIETRKEKSEGYSAVKGLFRQFELTYVVADERDLVRLRTNYRQGEEVYLFRLQTSPERMKNRFLEYVRRMNDLRQRPKWYNAVTDNCTTGIRVQHAAADRAPWDWRMLLNGHGDTLLYEHQAIDTRLPLAEVKERGHVNTRARAADQAPDFSRRIREGVPGIAP